METYSGGFIISWVKVVFIGEKLFSRLHSGKIYCANLLLVPGGRNFPSISQWLMCQWKAQLRGIILGINTLLSLFHVLLRCVERFGYLVERKPIPK